MKKLLALALVSALALSMSGCGNDKIVQGGASVDENGNTIIGTAIDGAGEEVNMEAIGGEELKASNSGKDKATVGNYVVSIDEARMIESDGKKLAVVSFDFKNKSGESVAFDNVMTVNARQNGSEVMATVVTGIEGINILSGVEVIEKGDSTKVQKVYEVLDMENPLVITVYKYGAPDAGTIQKEFNLK